MQSINSNARSAIHTWTAFAVGVTKASGWRDTVIEIRALARQARQQCRVDVLYRPSERLSWVGIGVGGKSTEKAAQRPLFRSTVREAGGLQWSR